MVRKSLAVAVLALGLTVLAPSAGAGGGFELDVTKVVEGPVPTGTEFVINVSCGQNGTSSEQDLTFGEAGGTQTFFTPFAGECTVTETDNGGADSVAYACNNDQVPANANNPSTCTSDQSATLADGVAEITVTNTYDEPEVEDPPLEGPPTVNDDNDENAPGAVVVATPTFTG